MSWWGTQVILAFARSGFGSRCFRLWRGTSLYPKSGVFQNFLITKEFAQSGNQVRQDLPSHSSWLLTGSTEYKLRSMLGWLTYAPSSGANSLFCVMETSCPFFWFSWFQLSPLHTWITFHMKPFSRMIFLPEVFLYSSRNYCGIYHYALSSFYESHPLGINFLVAEDSFPLCIFRV